MQRLRDGSLAFMAACPRTGAIPTAAVHPGDAVVVTDRSLANGHLAVAWDDTGVLVTVRSRDHDGELLRRAEASRWSWLPTTPSSPTRGTSRAGRAAGPAADECDSIEVVERGPLFGAVHVTRTVGPSTFATAYRLAAGSPRLDVVVDVDWHHDEHLLSLSLPLDVHSDHAVCDIQLGHVRRPTHASSSWDEAEFEVSAHRFVDLCRALVRRLPS